MSVRIKILKLNVYNFKNNEIIRVNEICHQRNCVLKDKFHCSVRKNSIYL